MFSRIKVFSNCRKKRTQVTKKNADRVNSNWARLLFTYKKTTAAEFSKECTSGSRGSDELTIVRRQLRWGNSCGRVLATVSSSSGGRNHLRSGGGLQETAGGGSTQEDRDPWDGFGFNLRAHGAAFVCLCSFGRKPN